MGFLKVQMQDKEPTGITVHRGNMKPSKGHASFGHVSTSSPIKSSWIQRLIPAYPARPEQQQHMNNLHTEKQCLNGLQADWSYDGAFTANIRDQSEHPQFENSRRSKQDFYSRHEFLLGNNTACNEQLSLDNSVASRVCTSVEAGQPKIQVLPRTLPVVESLLIRGCSKDVAKSIETNKLCSLSKCSGFSTPIRQTVHFSANERSRVSCSSIKGLNSRSARCATGDLHASLIGEKSLNALEGAVGSNMDICMSRKGKMCTHVGMDSLNAPRLEDHKRVPIALMGWPSTGMSSTSDDSSLDRHMMPIKARVDSFPECFMQSNFSTTRANKGLPVEQKGAEITCNTDFWHSQDNQEHGKGAEFASEVSFAKGDFFVEGWLNSGLGKGGSQRVSELVSSQFEGNLWEKPSILLDHRAFEEKLGSLLDPHKEQEGTSGSFSFHPENRALCESTESKVTERGTKVSERGHWPFCKATRHSENLVQRSLLQDRASSDPGEALRSRMSFNNLPMLPLEVGTPYVSRAHHSSFGTETFTEFARPGLASSYKATCMDRRAVGTGESDTQVSDEHDVKQAARSHKELARELRDGVTFPRLQSDMIVKPMEGRERKYSLPSRAFTGTNQDGCRPPFRICTSSVGSLESCSKRPAGNQMEGRATHAEASKTFTMAEGHLGLPPVCLEKHSLDFDAGCVGSLESCSKRPAGDQVEDRATHAEASKTFTMAKGHLGLPPVCLEKHSLDFDAGCSEGPKDKDEGVGVGSWDGSVFRRNMWLKRWSAIRGAEECSRLKSNRERSIVNSRHCAEDYSGSQDNWESSYQFDLRPAKRLCYGQGMGLHIKPCQGVSVMGSVASRKEREKGIDAGFHFMKRFLTPSAAAMAIMGMTAREIHVTQPQRRGLFGAWPVNASVNKPLVGHFEVNKEFLMRQKNKKEFVHTVPQPFSSEVNP